MVKNAWLVKSEPAKYPWQRLVEQGRTFWDGVRNFEARNNLRAMKLGDVALFYHSNHGKEIVGVAKVVKEACQDPTTTEDWSGVDLAPVVPLKVPVDLATMKAHPLLKDMAMVKRSRISVTKVEAAELAVILELGKTKLPKG